MSATRRILAVGLPAAAALVFAAGPALAVENHGARPVATASACASTERDKCDYGATGAGTTTDTPGDTSPTTPGDTAGGHTRGHGGYGSVSPTTTPPTTRPTSPSPSPSTHVDTVSPSPSGSVQGAHLPSPSASTGGGVKAATALPVTGPSMGAVFSLGGLMVAAGAASIWYTRRRRTV
jgi:LPXTG-motif cell wall-anchored protein